MSPREKASRSQRLRLLPHQAAFVETVFNPSSKRIIFLHADVGLGKSVALIAVSGRLLQERPAAKILFLAPAALKLQIADGLLQAGIPSRVVDRYSFREMLDGTVGEDIWPHGTVVVLSLEFAIQPDISDSLLRTRWDLLIVDESHAVSKARAEILSGVIASAGLVVFATATPRKLFLGDDFVEDKNDNTVVEWKTNKIVGHDGKKLFPTPRAILRELPFTFSPAELTLQEIVRELQFFVDAGGAKNWKGMGILRSLESSPAALERALKRFTEKLRMHPTEYQSEAFEDEMPDEDAFTGGMGRATNKEEAGTALRALREVENLSVDSKLGAFGKWLNYLNQLKQPSKRICVIVEFRATLFYVAAEIENRGMKCQLLHGEMGTEERMQALKSFSVEGEILLATSAVMQGIDLSHVSDLVLYDIPRGNALQQVLSRFNRFGRINELNVHVLVPTNGQTALFTKSFAPLSHVLSTS